MSKPLTFVLEIIGLALIVTGFFSNPLDWPFIVAGLVVAAIDSIGFRPPTRGGFTPPC